MKGRVREVVGSELCVREIKEEREESERGQSTERESLLSLCVRGVVTQWSGTQNLNFAHLSALLKATKRIECSASGIADCLQNAALLALYLQMHGRALGNCSRAGIPVECCIWVLTRALRGLKVFTSFW